MDEQERQAIRERTEKEARSSVVPGEHKNIRQIVCEDVPELLDEIDRLKMARNLWISKYTSAGDEIERLQKERDELKQALGENVAEWFGDEEAADFYALKKERDEWKRRSNDFEGLVYKMERQRDEGREKAESLEQRHQLILAKSIIPFDERKNIDPYDVIMDMGTVAEDALRGESK